MKSPFLVIVIDDEDKIRKDLEYAFRIEGTIVHTFTTAEAALAFVKDSFVPDVVIVDCDLGHGMSGLQFTKEYRDMDKDTPVLMFSGNSTAKDVFLTMAGGTAFFTKSQIDGLIAYVDDLREIQ